MYTVHAVSKYSRVHERSETTRGANLPFHLCLDREFVSNEYSILYGYTGGGCKAAKGVLTAGR